MKHIVTALFRVLALAVAVFHMPIHAGENDAIYLFNTLPISEQAYDQFLPIMQNNAKNTRKESGNITFDVFSAEKGGSTIYLFEQWKNQQALDSHMQTDHLQAVIHSVGDAMQQGKSESSLRLRKITSDNEPDQILSPATTRNIIVTLHALPDRRNALVEALLNVTEHARTAPGNIRFDLYQSVDDHNTLVLFERWRNVTSHEQHLVQEYNNALNEMIKSALSQPIEQTRLLLKDVAQANSP